MTYNRGLIEDPAAFAQENGAASWLYPCGEAHARHMPHRTPLMRSDELRAWVAQGLDELA